MTFLSFSFLFFSAAVKQQDSSRISKYVSFLYVTLLAEDGLAQGS